MNERKTIEERKRKGEKIRESEEEKWKIDQLIFLTYQI